MHLNIPKNSVLLEKVMLVGLSKKSKSINRRVRKGQDANPVPIAIGSYRDAKS